MGTQSVDRIGQIRGGVSGLLRVVTLAVIGIRTVGSSGGEATVQLDGHSPATGRQQQPFDTPRKAARYGAAAAAVAETSSSIQQQSSDSSEDVAKRIAVDPT